MRPKLGWILIGIICGVLLLPRVVFLLNYGRLPCYEGTFGAKQGMAAEEVVRLIGKPHKRYPQGDGEEMWIYFTDTLAFGYDGVIIDKNNFVRSSWTH